MKVEEKKRRVRSDKKRDIKPTISMDLREVICRLSYITTTPIKDVGGFICVFGLDTKEVIDILANYFRRDLVVNSTCYVGDLERPSLQRVKLEGPTERITIRFKQGTYEKINALAYALDVTPSKATALLLEVSLKDSNVINRYVKSYLKETLDGKRLKELKKILKFIIENNPYDEEFSWTEFMSYMFEGMKNQSKSMKNTLNDWIDKYK
ncbi:MULTISPECIES: hypothetical protein [Bacillus cereus group]|uniref:hypothetical protein n=1 Tax=Bacillus cereus group TaxID=86661 RepID=UPI0025A53558|nr:hypothetical protein [Bacillus thuringiensis]MDM8365453.1 hypothetical protein [Bacillus thuringiensis]